MRGRWSKVHSCNTACLPLTRLVSGGAATFSQKHCKFAYLCHVARAPLSPTALSDDVRTLEATRCNTAAYRSVWRRSAIVSVILTRTHLRGVPGACVSPGNCTVWFVSFHCARGYPLAVLKMANSYESVSLSSPAFVYPPPTPYHHLEITAR